MTTWQTFCNVCTVLLSIANFKCRWNKFSQQKLQKGMLKNRMEIRMPDTLLFIKMNPSF